MSRLRHRLAGLAFPPGQRRDELIGTLADAEEELGTRAPGPREALDIARHGLRARLGRPRNPVVVPFALLVMLLGAFAGGAVATQAAWKLVPPLPTGERAAEISGTVFPGLTVYGGGEARDVVAEPSAEGGPVYGFVDYTVRHTDATRDLAAYAAGARARLTAAGWDVHEIAPEADSGTPVTPVLEEEFWAQRDGLLLRFLLFHWPDAPVYDGDGGGQFTLSRTPPGWIWWAVPAGAPIGAVLTFLVFGWVSRRTDHEGSLGSLLAMFYVIPALFELIFVADGVRRWWRPDPSSPPVAPFWASGVSEISAFPLYLLILSTAGMLLLAAARRPYPLAWLRPLTGRRRSGLAAAGLVIVTAVAFLVWPSAAPRPCGPDGLPRPPTAAQAGFSTEFRVYVDRASTQDQRNLLEAAIFRSGGSSAWKGNEYGGWPWSGCSVSVPWFDVSFAGPGMFDRLLAEVSGMPGVLAVHRAA